MFNSVQGRCIGSASNVPTISNNTSELDSHADTMCAGSNCKIESTTGHTVRVKPFSEELGAIEEVPIGSVLTAYTHPSTGECFILRFNEALIFGDRLQSSLINPNQIRAHGATVSDVPKQFDSTSTHSIVGIEERKGQTINLPLSLKGIISFLPTSYPTDEQLESCSYITLTSAVPWDPYSTAFETEEDRQSSAVTSKSTCYSGGGQKHNCRYQLSHSLP